MSEVRESLQEKEVQPVEIKSGGLEQEPKASKRVEEKPKVDLIPVNEDQRISPKDHKQLGSLIETIAKGGGFPTVFDNQEKRIAAFNMARALMGDQWQLCLNHMYYIKGKLSIFGELPRAIAERTGEVAEFMVYCLDKNYVKICTENKNINAEPWAGVCIVQRKGREKQEFTYTLDEATKAGQYPAKKSNGETNPDSPWMKFTKIMLYRKAQALAVKFEFPDALLGVEIAEYDHGEAPDLIPMKDVTNSANREQEVLRKFRDVKEA